MPTRKKWTGMWNKNWKTYKQHKLSNRSKQIKDLHNHTDSRQNQSKLRMPANVSVKGGKTKRTLEIRGKNDRHDPKPRRRWIVKGGRTRDPKPSRTT